MISMPRMGICVSGKGYATWCTISTLPAVAYSTCTFLKRRVSKKLLRMCIVGEIMVWYLGCNDTGRATDRQCVTISLYVFIFFPFRTEKSNHVSNADAVYQVDTGVCGCVGDCHHGW